MVMAKVMGLTLLEWWGVLALILFIPPVLLLPWIRRRNGIAGGAGREAGGSPVALPTGHEKILVVDDDPLVLESMQRTLGSLGYQIVGVPSGEEAVQYMKTNGADLILLDLLLGAGMDGTATYDQIRRIRPFQRVIVLSGYATPDQVAALRRIGVEHYLIKPVPRLMLAQTIRTELSRP
jgi:CheY-like chemotaxis protein